MVFAWEDPWHHEGPHCHIALSGDGGARWRYVRLPDGCNALACGPGPLRVFSGGWEGPRFTDLNRRHQLALEVL